MSKRIVLTSWGSWGDIQPFLAVALGLRSRGHRVTVAGPASYSARVEREGLAFVATRPDMPLPSPPRSFDPMAAIEDLLRYGLLPHLKESYDDLLPACRDADLIVGHILSFAVPLVADQLRVPWLTMVLQPMAFYSNYDPPFVASAPWLYPLRKLGPRPYSVLWALRNAGTRGWAEPIHSLRRELGLPAAAGSSLRDCWRSPFGTLAAFSSEFARPQPDWPQPAWITGFPHLDAGLPATPGLQDFLSRGDAPIVFTLGDSASRVPGVFYRVSLAAVRRLGCRAVFLTGSHARTSLPEFPPERVWIAEYAPYSQVFPHAAAVVHAGGIGTIALALRARRPMLLVPLFFDQADNSRRACGIAVARSLDRPHYTCDAVCRELNELLSNPAYARQAANIGARISAEDGVAAACERIESVLATGNRAGVEARTS